MIRARKEEMLGDREVLELSGAIPSIGRSRKERVVAIVVAALAAGVLLWGVLAEQLGETLFNATLV